MKKVSIFDEEKPTARKSPDFPGAKNDGADVHAASSDDAGRSIDFFDTLKRRRCRDA
jgi:hypothetical protein